MKPPVIEKIRSGQGTAIDSDIFKHKSTSDMGLFTTQIPHQDDKRPQIRKGNEEQKMSNFKKSMDLS